MNISLTARFKSSGSPQTGLSPTVTVWEINGDTRTDKGTFNMSELSDGVYAYNYTNFNILGNYLFLFDAGASSDQRYLESEWSGIQDFVGQIPRGGGGRSIAITQSELKAMSDGLSENLKGLFDNLELKIDMPELDTKGLEKAIKEFEKSSKAEQKRLADLIGKKLQEVSKPTIITETVDTKAMTDQLARSAEVYLSKASKSGKDEIDGLLGEFAKFLSKDVKEMLEDIKSGQMEVARQEARQELADEIRNNPDLLTKILR